MQSALRLTPDALGNGSSITLLVKSVKIVYNTIDIATTAMMIIMTIFFLIIDFEPLSSY